MKAILEFNLDDKEDLMAHKRAVKSLDMACVLFEIRSNLRRRLEDYIENNKPQNSHMLLEQMFEEINNEFDEHNINLDELIE